MATLLLRAAFVACYCAVPLRSLVLSGGPQSYDRVFPTTLVAPRQYHFAVANATHVIVAGGQSTTTNAAAVQIAGLSYVGEVPFVYAGAATAAVIPSDRAAFALVHLESAVIGDTSNDYALVFGGYNSAGAVTNNLARLDYTGGRAPTWSLVPVTGTVPAARSRAAGVYLARCSVVDDSATGCFVVYGGADTNGLRLGDGNVLALPAASWSSPVQLAINAPAPRHSATLVAGLDGHRVYLFGGDTAAGVSSDLYVMSPQQFPDIVPSECTNLAAGRPAVYGPGNQDPVIGGPASRVTDGSIAGLLNPASSAQQAQTDPTVNLCAATLTSGITNPWIRVDLGSVQLIDGVQWFGRTDCNRLVGAAQLACSTLNIDFEVWYSQTANGALIPQNQYQAAGHTRCTISADDLLGGSTIVDCRNANGNPVSARYVYVVLPGTQRQLVVCEIQVLRRRPWVWRALSGTVDVAQGKSVASSSEYGYGSAFKATDGVYTNDFSTETCVSTRYDGASGFPGAFQEVRVDLGGEFDVSSLELWPVLTGYSYAAGRTTGWSISAGLSHNPVLNTPCSVPSDITPPGGVGSTVIPCAARARFVVLRRYWSAAANDDTVTFCELRVWAAALLNAPPPRAGHAAAGFRGQMVLFGGYDAAGYRLNDMAFFDMNTQTWGAPSTPLGTAPVGRAYASLLPVNSNTMQIFGGSGTTGMLGDIINVDFPPCAAPWPFSGASVSGNPGDTECRQLGTDCTYTCAGAYVPYLANSGLATCMPDGSIVGTLPLCILATPPNYAPVSVTVSPGPGFATVSWSPPLAGPAPTNYWVRPWTDGGQQEEYYLFTDPAPPARYTWYDPSATPFFLRRGAARYISSYNLEIIAPPASDCSATANACPRWFLNTWPTLLPRNNFAFETQVQLGAETDGFNGYSAGIAIQDSSLGVNGNGAPLFFLGLQRSWPYYQVVWTSTTARTANPWSFTTPISTSMALGQSVQLRIELSNATGFQFAAFWRTSSLMNWNTMPRFAGPADTGNMNPANMRAALMVRNTQATVPAVADFAYFKLALSTCLTAGPSFLVPSSVTSVNVTGLTGGVNYAWGVQASVTNALTWGSYTYSLAAPGTQWGTPIPANVRTPPLVLLEVAGGRPTSQSSTLFTAVPSLANDGNVAQAFYGAGGNSTFQCASTTVANSASTSLWWQVDLGAPTDVEQLTIWNTRDHNPEWLNGLAVYASETPDYTRGVSCPQQNIPFSIGAPSFAATFPCALTGRYITIHSPNNIQAALQLCEVQVFAGNACPARGATNAFPLAGTGSCAAGAPYGTACAFQCNDRYKAVSGAAIARCQGSSWSDPELVCMPICDTVNTPQFTAGCEQVLAADDFSAYNPVNNVSLVPGRWSPLYSRQAWGTYWFTTTSPSPAGNYLTAAARHGCNNDLVLMLNSDDATAWSGPFRMQASVLALDRAGLAFRISAEPIPSYYRFVGDRWTNGVALELVVQDAVTLLATNPTIYDITKNTFSTFTVEADGPLITCWVEGILAFTILDNTLSGGSAGLYAQSQASFDDFSYTVPCVSCQGVTEGESCTLTPYPGLLVEGNTTMTCWGGQWFPPVPPAFSLPPPEIANMVFTVPELSAINTPVGSPLEATCPVPDLQVGYAILSNATNNAAFWIDQCGGQIRVRSPTLDSTVQPVYVLTVSAFIVDFPDVSAQATVTITLTPGARPVAAPAGQVLRLPENAPPGSPVGAVVFNSSFAPGSVVFRLVNDGSRGRLVVNASTGFISVSPANTLPLDFEVTSDNTWTLTIEFHPLAFPTASTTVNVVVVLQDGNDVPALPLGYTLRIADTTLVPPSVALTPALSTATVDEDALNGPTSLFLLPPRFALAPLAQYNATCGVAIPGFYPTDTGFANGSALFTIDPVSGTVTQTLNPATPWASRALFTFFNAPVRAVYSLCVVVTDTSAPVAGLQRTAPAIVYVAISASSSAAWPIVGGFSPANLMDTAGGQVINFTVTGSATPLALTSTLRATYTNGPLFPQAPPVPGATTYNATSCVILSPGTFSCVTAPGVGTGHRWSFFYRAAGLAEEQLASSVTVLLSYRAPVILNITTAAGGALPTAGGTLVTIVGSGFGPAFNEFSPSPPRHLISLTYGPTSSFACTYFSNTQTLILCFSGAGAGANLPLTLTVGNQAVSPTGSAGTTLSYLPPAVTQLTVLPPLTLTSFSPYGGETFYIAGTNFGPATPLSTPIVVTYGLSNEYTAANCVRRPTVPVTLQCSSAQGVGSNLGVTVSIAGQASAVFNASNISYSPPVITGIAGPGASRSLGATTGGEAVTISGTFFGPSSTPAGDVVAMYGTVSGSWTFTATGCAITTGGIGANAITCLTAPGTGANHFWVLVLGGVMSAPFASNLAYAPPTIVGFSGSVVHATTGNEIVVISGYNFGPATGYTDLSLRVTYFARPDMPPGGFTAGNFPQVVSFAASNCSVTGAHTAITCTTSAGAGMALQWVVIVDGVFSGQPTTTYCPPTISNVTFLDAGGMPVFSGQLVPYLPYTAVVLGSCFGPSGYTPAPIFPGQNVTLPGANATTSTFPIPLLESVSYGPTGLDYILQPGDLSGPLQFAYVSDTMLMARVGPGATANNFFRVMVAGQLSTSAAPLPGTPGVSFSFIAPTVVSVSPQSAPIFSDPSTPTIVTVVGRNLPLFDPVRPLRIQFGSGAFAVTLDAIAPATPTGLADAQQDPADPSLISVQFALPRYFAGAGLPVVVVASGPNGAVLTASPVNPAALFSYADPVIATPTVNSGASGPVTVTVACFAGDSNCNANSSTVFACPFANGTAPGFSCDNSNPAGSRLLQLVISGANFGADPLTTSPPDGVQRTLEVSSALDALTGPNGTAPFSAARIYWQQWTNTRIIAYTYVPGGAVRVSLTSPWSGTTQRAVSPFSGVSPAILSVSGAVMGVPTSGCLGSLATGANCTITVTVNSLDGATGVSLFVGNASCPLVAAATGMPVTDVSGLLTAQPGPVWTLTCAPPPGQGAGVPVVVVRTIGTLSSPSDAGATISYAPPVLTGFAVMAFDGSWPAPTTSLNASSVTVGTAGTTSVRLYGSSLGTAPRITVRGVVLDASSGAVRPCGLLATAFDACVEFTAPPGEGTGLQPYGPLGLPLVPLTGFTLSLSAGNQVAAPVLPFRYLPPVVASVLTNPPGAFLSPLGGAQLIIGGTNFGSPVGPDRGLSIVTLSFGRDVDGPASFLACTNLTRVSHTQITCTLPRGTGSALSAFLAVADLSSESANQLSYDGPVLNEVYAVVARPPVSLLPAIVNQTYEYYSPRLDAMVTNWTLVTVNPPPVDPNITVTDPRLYVPPGISAIRVTGGLVLTGEVTTLTGPSDGGGVYFTLLGNNFGAGPATDLAACVLLSSPARSMGDRTPVCNNAEDYLGEGEVGAANVVSWNNTMIVFLAPPAVGFRRLDLNLRGGRLAGVTSLAIPGAADLASANSARIEFVSDPPNITNILPATGVDTDGNSIITITGSGFGWAALQQAVPTLPAPNDDVFVTPVPLALAVRLPTTILQLNFWTSCVSDARSLADGVSPNAVVASLGCSLEILQHSPNAVIFRAPPGVGAGRALSAAILIPRPRGWSPTPALSDTVATSPSLAVSYSPPLITRTTPNLMLLGSDPAVNYSFLVSGFQFGNPALIGPMSPADAAVQASVGAAPCQLTQRITLGTTVVVSCVVNVSATVAGPTNVTLLVANQAGTEVDADPLRQLVVGCASTYFAAPGELCFPCPDGATCVGYDGTQANPFTYPLADAGWFNFAGPANGSCPSTFRVYPGRDVCVAPCEPEGACLAANQCSPGYASTAPQFRCATCAPGFYRRYASCQSCPGHAMYLFVGYIVLVAACAAVAYGLSKTGVTVPLLAVALDFVQVLSTLQYTRVDWPQELLSLFHVLSAFYLNVEIVAPECSIPSASYTDKFAFIMLLPISFFALLLLIQACIVAYRVGVMRRRDKLDAGASTLVATGLLVMYGLYIYLTRTLLEVFSCVPTTPPDNYEYFLPSFSRCHEAGSLQRTLLPWAIIALVVYTAAYPLGVLWLLWRHRELIMEDQLLRAKGVGGDRLTNPHALKLRKTWGRLYYQFKPDSFYWIFVVLLRKFFVSFLSVMFNRNAAFQMAAWVIALMIAYSLQTTVRPYMGPGDAEDVLRAHVEASFSSAVHARLRTTLAGIEGRGRKSTRKNLLDYNGRVDRRALAGIAYSYATNYNTVESVSLFTLTMVALLGLMYESQRLAVDYYADARVAATDVVLVLVSLTLAYIFIVMSIDLASRYAEGARDAKLLNKRRSSKKLAGAAGQEAEPSPKPRRASSSLRSGGEVGDLRAASMDQQLNPLFTSGIKEPAKGGAGASAAELAAAKKAMEALGGGGLPTPEMWRMFLAANASLTTQAEALSAEVARLRMELEQERAGGAAAATPRPGVGGGRAGASRTAFSPMVARSSDTPAPGPHGSFVNPINSSMATYASSRRL